MKQFFFLISVIFSVSCSSETEITSASDQAEHYFEKAMSYEYYQGCEIQKAYFDSVLLINPNNAKIWFEKSTWEIKVGNYSRYMEYMDKAVSLDPKSYLGWRGAVKLYYLRDFKGAIKDLVEHNNLYPTTTTYPRGESCLFLIGMSYKGLGNFQLASNYLKKYIQEVRIEQGLEWVDPYAFVYLSTCLFELGKFEDAINSLETCIEVFDNIPEAYYHLGKIMNKMDSNVLPCGYISTSYELSNSLKADTYRELDGQVYVRDIKELLNKWGCNKNK